MKSFAVIAFMFLLLLQPTSNAQNIYTFAGTGSGSFNGDGLMATTAQLQNPYGVAVDASGAVYIADAGNNRIRKVNTSGIIITIAGNGSGGYGGDGGVATSAQLFYPSGIAVDASGNLYIADAANNRIRKVDAGGIISTFAGTGVGGYNGDGGTATTAQLSAPFGVALDGSGNLYIADAGNNRIRKVNTAGIISTIAGTGLGGFSGDGGAATAAQLFSPRGVAVNASGEIFIADKDNHRIRKVTTTGIISSVAGTGAGNYSGDGGAAVSADLNSPSGITVDASNNLILADAMNARIRKINTAGIISTIAGTCCPAGFSGDGGTATLAQLYAPRGVAVDALGNVYIADTDNHRVRIVCVGSCLVNVTRINEDTDNVVIFPNPNNGSFKLQISGKLVNAKLILTNALGQMVYEQNIMEGENVMDPARISKGLYHYVLLQNNICSHSGKLVIE